MSGDFSDWNQEPAESQNVAPHDIDKMLKRQARGATLRLLIVLGIMVAAACFLWWKWIAPNLK
jgi:hypothetical protein